MTILEGQTLPVNPVLFQAVVYHYESLIKAIHYIKYKKSLDKEEENKDFGKIFNDLLSKNGMKALQTMYRSGHTAIFYKVKLQKRINVNNDPILSRKIKQEELDDLFSKMPDDQKTLKLAFYFQNPNISGIIGTSRGFYQAKTKQGLNVLYIALYDEIDSGKVSEDMKSTIRHELQHFSQIFYPNLFGHSLIYGLPGKRADYLKNARDAIAAHNASEDPDKPKKPIIKHSDQPAEIATDVQDAIDEFVQDIIRRRSRNEKINLKDEIFEYVGIGGNKELSSRVFLHYYKTNKKLWRWATSKLLSAVSRM